MIPNNSHTVLIVDDEADIRELLGITINRMEINTLEAETLVDAKNFLGHQKIDACLTDMRLPDGNGIDLINHIQQHYPHIPIAMITAYGNMDSAVQALKAGAFDFVSKPIELKVLRDLVASALKLAGKTSPQVDNAVQGSQKSLPQLIGNSPIMQNTSQLIKKLARSQAPIYIQGESGTGKEIAAKLIHLHSSRKDRPFIPINCGAIPTELMESEFFGHKKGSFTGAIRDKEGLFQAADGGTLFLDEVADLPLSMQVKLLRSIQEKSFRPVGSQKEYPIDIRFISATHKNLQTLVDAGTFRQDFYYRINVIELPLPALRERKEDIPLLIHYFLSMEKRNSTEAIHIDDAAIKQLMQYHFPGNVRELENILERAIALCDNHNIFVEDLALSTSTASVQSVMSQPVYPEPVIANNTSNNNIKSGINTEQQVLLDALEQTRWNRKAAAKLLNITYRQLRYRLKKMDIE